ncbi:hypothetical protein K474DRAFT_1684236 [Panus rudis PR-1116 ss-1]|nr:hypothetical protein K474DRAFT_1684236 [Panus rudis PR-1116 ss-1]
MEDGQHLSPAATAAQSTLAAEPRTADLQLLSPSARTSFTRVNLSNVDVDSAQRAHDDALAPDVGADDTPQQAAAVEPAIPHDPQVSLTFLLISGRRRVMSFDQETTIGRVKELVWNAWPNEWQDERPPAPSYLRILYLGKILQDDDTLREAGFPSYLPTSSDTEQTNPPSTIVHLSIRAYAPATADESLKKKGRRRRGGEAGDDDEYSPRCHCGACIIC